MKVKPKPLTPSGQQRSAIFDGLNEDDETNLSRGEIFVPRKSIKKLNINPKSPSTFDTPNENSSTLLNLSQNDSLTNRGNNPNQVHINRRFSNSSNVLFHCYKLIFVFQSLNESVVRPIDDSLNLPPVVTADDSVNKTSIVDESFSALINRKKNPGTTGPETSKDRQVEEEILKLVGNII